MAITWADAVAFALGLASITAPTIQQLLLDITLENVNAVQFCGDTTALYTLACLNHIAHLGTLQIASAEAGTAAGTVASESVGGLSVSYAKGFGAGGVLSYSRAGYERTPYGTTFLELLRTSPCGTKVAIMVV